MAYPVRVELTILDANDEYVWHVAYSSTRSVLINFPSDEPLFSQGVGGFDDLFLEVAGEVPSGLFMETARERVPLLDGEALHFMPSRGERSVRLMNAAGEALCSWMPRFRFMDGGPIGRNRGFIESNFWVFHNLGEPILLGFGASVAATHADFTIEGIPARVLARQQDAVVLRDPKPSVGRRTVESAGERGPLRFIQLDLEFSKRPPKGNAVLRVRVPKLKLLTPQVLSRVGRTVFYKAPMVMLFNETRDIVELRCEYEPPSGDYFLVDLDLGQTRDIVIRPKMIRDGVFTAECPVQFRKEGPVRISAAVVEIVPPL